MRPDTLGFDSVGRSSPVETNGKELGPRRRSRLDTFTVPDFAQERRSNAPRGATVAVDIGAIWGHCGVRLLCRLLLPGQKLQDFIEWHGSPEQETLEFVDTVVLQPVQLEVGFHAFGNSPQIH